MRKETLQLQQKQHFNISINDEPFYAEEYIYEEYIYEEDPINPILAQASYVKSDGGDYFIVECVKANYVEKFDPYGLDTKEEEYLEYLQRVGLLRDIDLDKKVYKPKIFDEQVALECGLIPFCYVRNIYKEHESVMKLLALRPDDDVLKLDAYQILTYGTIDKQRLLLQDKEAFAKIIGTAIIAKIEKKLINVI